MRFLVDNQLPVALARWLSSKGHDAVHVLDVGWGQTLDRKIWDQASAEGQIVVSKDEDFALLASRENDTGSLLWLRIGNCRTAALLASLEPLLPVIEQAFQSGQKLVEIR